MDIKAKDIKRLLMRLYKRYQSGAISENKAQKEAYLLNSILKAIEVTDIEERVTTMEESINVTLNLK
jgi:histone H3/H4